jgi:hypothetical protein
MPLAFMFDTCSCQGGCPNPFVNVLRLSCRPYADKYADDKDAFFAAYAQSHAKLSELGVKWEGEPITLD